MLCCSEHWFYIQLLTNKILSLILQFYQLWKKVHSSSLQQTFVWIFLFSLTERGRSVFMLIWWPHRLLSTHSMKKKQENYQPCLEALKWAKFILGRPHDIGGILESDDKTLFNRHHPAFSRFLKNLLYIRVTFSLAVWKYFCLAVKNSF